MMEDSKNLMERNHNKRKKNKYKLTIKLNKKFFKPNKSALTKILAFIILISLIIVSSFIFIFMIFKRRNNIDSLLTKNNIPSNDTQFESQSEQINPEFENIKNIIIDKDNKEEKKVKLEELKNEIINSTNEDEPSCEELDPINIFNKRLQVKPTTICQNGKSNHICYKDGNGIFVAQNGVLCKMENIIIDPSKWRDGGFIYKGPVDEKSRGCPILSKGFFNIKCETHKEYSGYDFIYDNYFNGWNYKYNNTNEELEELAPGKTVFFLSRNQDSPNLYHGGSEFVNAVSLLHLFDKNPEDIQVVFLDSIVLNDDPFYDLYKNLISRGGEPIYVRNLTKKYRVSSAIHVPINWDSPCFINSGIPSCKYPTKTYKFYNGLIDLYMNISKFKDTFVSDNQTFYYPKSIINNHKSNINFTKIVTFQWRRVWPRGRKGQQRILGNGPELADKLASKLPKNILLRLIDTAALPISQQISILRETDYYVGIHGAGLTLSIFAPSHCIVHEVLPESNMNGLLLMAALSGHKTYSDIISSDTKNIKGNENVFFEPDYFVNAVISHLKENKIID